ALRKAEAAKHKGLKSCVRTWGQELTNASLLTLLFWTPKLFEPFLFDRIVAPSPKSCAVHGATWIGKTRVGKPTASTTIGFVVSAYQIKKHRRADLRPSAATARKIDFLRPEPGGKFEPAIADDTALTKWGPDEIKAFLDPAEEEALLRAR
ncbi:unnamed protein product, partial [Prorocentrum cordatum]